MEACKKKKNSYGDQDNPAEKKQYLLWSYIFLAIIAAQKVIFFVSPYAPTRLSCKVGARGEKVRMSMFWNNHMTMLQITTILKDAHKTFTVIG